MYIEYIYGFQRYFQDAKTLGAVESLRQGVLEAKVCLRLVQVVAEWWLRFPRGAEGYELFQSPMYRSPKY